MASETDLNLREVTRALGQQNPEWKVGEFVQPVVQIADFGGIVPAHVPPVGAWGNATAAVAGERAVVLFECRAPGGARIQFEYAAAAGFIGKWGLLTAATPAITAPIVATDRGPFSNSGARSVVTSGTVPAAVFGNDAPFVQANGTQLLVLAPARNALWIPPAGRWWFELQANAQVINFSLIAAEIPVVEGGR